MGGNKGEAGAIEGLLCKGLSWKLKCLYLKSPRIPTFLLRGHINFHLADLKHLLYNTKPVPQLLRSNKNLKITQSSNKEPLLRSYFLTVLCLRKVAVLVGFILYQHLALSLSDTVWALGRDVGPYHGYLRMWLCHPQGCLSDRNYMVVLRSHPYLSMCGICRFSWHSHSFPYCQPCVSLASSPECLLPYTLYFLKYEHLFGPNIMSDIQKLQTDEHLPIGNIIYKRKWLWIMNSWKPYTHSHISTIRVNLSWNKAKYLSHFFLFHLKLRIM